MRSPLVHEPVRTFFEPVSRNPDIGWHVIDPRRISSYPKSVLLYIIVLIILTIFLLTYLTLCLKVCGKIFGARVDVEKRCCMLQCTVSAECCCCMQQWKPTIYPQVIELSLIHI